MINSERPADLDDLFIACRAENAKRAFGEAVACFRAGAYRASIVATWTAVVFDYLGKLRELELAGNKEAANVLLEFENARASSNIPLAQKLEGQVLADAAVKFELLTPIEHEDLERLRLDRHRCAHPSLLTLDEPYQPPAELARVHMRNAVTHLLSRPPLQGREAWERVWADVSSEYFPLNQLEAVERIQLRLTRARPSLVRMLIIELTKKLLGPYDQNEDMRADARAHAALAATVSLHHAEAERLLREKFDKLADSVPDSNLHRLVHYCRRVSLAWSALGRAMQGKLRTFVEGAAPMVLDDALEIVDLRECVVKRIPRLGDGSLIGLAQRSRDTAVLDEIVARFEGKALFTTFRDLRPALNDEDLRARWTVDQRKRLVRALATNDTLKSYMGYESVIEGVLEISSSANSEDEWRPVFEFCISKKWLLAVARAIRAIYPNFPDVPDVKPTDPAAESSVASSA
ncbi:hypothetical protein [Pendulispora albinea]|uniref:Uncharacterized protein n=1 Tax=Pendulispora albinea TaxID=2741071 RepID=A0ABZ2M0B0_9BACT